MPLVRTFLKSLAICAVLFILAVCAGAQVTGSSGPFQCGDKLKPGVTYAQLAKCYQYENKVASTLRDTLADTQISLEQAQGQIVALGEQYDKSQSNGRVIALMWGDAGKVCDDNDAKRVADYNNLVADYNNLLMAAKVMALSAPSGSPARVWNAPTAPTYTPQRRLYCNTVLGATSCYEQ